MVVCVLINTMACVTNSLCMGTDAMKVPCDASVETPNLILYKSSLLSIPYPFPVNAIGKLTKHTLIFNVHIYSHRRFPNGLLYIVTCMATKHEIPVSTLQLMIMN